MMILSNSIIFQKKCLISHDVFVDGFLNIYILDLHIFEGLGVPLLHGWLGYGLRNHLALQNDTTKYNVFHRLIVFPLRTLSFLVYQSQAHLSSITTAKRNPGGASLTNYSISKFWFPDATSIPVLSEAQRMSTPKKMWSFQTHRNQQKSTEINNMVHIVTKIISVWPIRPILNSRAIKGPAQFPPEVRLGAIP